jgi:subtilisin family serine protease
MLDEELECWPDLQKASQALKTGNGAGVKVAIIDSGVDLSHSDLSGLRLVDDIAVSCDGSNIKIEENTGDDLYGHGTAVTSLLLKEATGVQVGSFRALDSRNHARNFVIAECVNQAIARGYQVINCSFGCRGRARFVMDYKEWIDQAYLKGVQVVAACSNVDSGVREWPAYFPSVFSVKGIDCEEGDFFSRSGEMVSFMARGERVTVPWLGGGTKVETGSSYAAPVIAGKIAKLISAFPEIEPGLLKPMLQKLAKQA